MEHPTVERSIWIAAQPERVWQALANPAELGQWLMPPAMGAQLTRDERGTLAVNMGGMLVPLAALESAAEPHRLRYRSLPDGIIATAYQIERDGDGSRVTVTMEGFDRLPAEARQDRLASSGAAWDKALQNMRAHISGQALPFPEGYVAALFGYRRESRQLFAVERSIWIAAPRERVWQALTDPAQIERWFSPGTRWGISALEVGGRLFVVDPETGAEQHSQLIAVVEPPERFAVRTPTEPSGRSEMTDHTLREEAGGTRLTITSSGYEWLPEDNRWAMMEQNAFGFGMMLENLRAYVEGGDLPYPGGF